MDSNQQQLDLPTEDVTPEQTAATAERDRIREVYRARLAEKLKDPEFRKIEGFPIGTDEAILALSDPPYYTACPNPFIEEWLQKNAKPYDPETDDYHREPFAADVSEGKNDPIYNAHSYHTKVPHKAIMRYILHYTEPGDIVYDGFCGTGMTGVAAQMCGNKDQVESLGYAVTRDGTVADDNGAVISAFGVRNCVLNDLSPAATFISYNYNATVDATAFMDEAAHVLTRIESECGWMYSTLHNASEEEANRVANAVLECPDGDSIRRLYDDLKLPNSRLRDPGSKLQLGRINYVIWSDVLTCPTCGSDLVFWNVAVNRDADKVRDNFECPQCRAITTKRKCNRSFESFYDDVSNTVIRQAKQAPVHVSYTASHKRYSHVTDPHDIALIKKIGQLPIPYPYPTDRMPKGDESRRNDPAGLTNVHHFYTRRNIWTIGATLSILPRSHWFIFTALTKTLTKMFRWAPGGKHTAGTSGTLYVPSVSHEYPIFEAFERRVRMFSDLLAAREGFLSNSTISTASASAPLLRNESVSYIFTDPPFGGNLMYSELNFITEAWLRVYTNNKSEAITNTTQNKGIREYQLLMANTFAQYYRVLQSGHWMTVEFHNSANSVWNAIQEALERVGFVVADVRILNKQQETFKQVTTSAAVKQDLVISCYKPRADFEKRFQLIKGNTQGVFEFVVQHLAMLPITPITKLGQLEPVAERNRFLLFDRMIAYHLQRGAPIPLSSPSFYKLLEEQFTRREDMYFLPSQAAKYDALKASGVETEQLSIFVQDEKSCVQWLRAELNRVQQSLGELTPKFMQELREWSSFEPRPELRDLLREYFVPGAGGVWRVPDPEDERDIAALRKSGMLRLFQGYAREKGPLKTFRKEAIVEGFKECFETKQYSVIVSICERIPDKVLQEIPEFVMFYDIAKDLAPSQIVQPEFVWD